MYICSVTNELRETLVLEYGTQLFSLPGMWETGLSYLDHCPESGKATQILLLSSLPLTTDHQTSKIVRAAMNRGLQEVGK